MAFAIGLVIAYLAAAACVSCQELTSTLRDRSHACPGEEVIFTCTVRGSADVTTLILAWSSTEYIGQGALALQFTSQDSPGMNRTNGNATAKLISNTSIDGEPELVSELRIIVDQPSTVTCKSVTLSSNMSKEFNISEIPGMVLDPIAIELFGATGSGCVIFAQWERPSNIDDSYISYYIIHDGMSNTSYISSELSRVIYLSICVAQSLSIRAFDMCNRDGAIVKVPIQFHSALRNNETTTTATDVTDATSANPQSADAIGIGATALILAIIGLITVTAVVIYSRWIWNKVSQQDNNNANSQLGDEIELTALNSKYIDKLSLEQAKEILQDVIKKLKEKADSEAAEENSSPG